MNNKILELIRDLANEGATVTFSEDWGQNSLTIVVEHSTLSTHTHTGLAWEDFDTLSENTIDALQGFLEWIQEAKKVIDKKS